MMYSEMNTRDSGLPLGIVTDEDAMYDLLAKFLSKEGYTTARVLPDAPDTSDVALVILAPTREPSRSKGWLDNLKTAEPTVLVVQCCEEDYADVDGNVILLKDRPLNLRHLSETVARTLEKTARHELRTNNNVG